ncbi:hypothetical protein [Pseudomonas phage PPpW-3]|uniref:Uncharacterized protein n=1 Tax=Pseudomonas phage PPpW-3 TaxID=1279082 RepID=V5YTL4_9CAUD|nr:hypothetical protein X916_gp58 [Pseudomonas phage PPpW-3]BAO20658.1 hypothetical protein [Pseudomonas phage PPpW-3]
MQIGPCKGCGSTLEQQQDPLNVLCDECRYKATNPPPTVEYRQVGHFKYSAGLLLYTFLVLMAGFLMGFAVRFGV